MRHRNSFEKVHIKRKSRAKRSRSFNSLSKHNTVIHVVTRTSRNNIQSKTESISRKSSKISSNIHQDNSSQQDLFKKTEEKYIPSTRNDHLDKTNRDEDEERKRRRRYLGGYCCPCSPLCQFCCVISTLLLAAIIAAIILAVNSSKSIVSTTTQTTTTTTSATTTTTTVSTTTVTTSTSTTASTTTVSTTTVTTSTSTATSTTTVSTTTVTTSTTATTSTAPTTATATTTTTTTTTPRPMCPITATGDFIKGVYNTVAGGPTGGYEGRYSPYTEKPPQAIDNNLNTKYLNYGTTAVMNSQLTNAGKDSGFFVTPTAGISLANGVLFSTGDDWPERDPLTMTLEGTNATNLNSSSIWTLLYTGPTGLETTLGRKANGTIQTFPNSLTFKSYRLLILTQRDIQDSVQYSESHIMRYC